MWSLVKLKNQTKAIFSSNLLKKSNKSTHVNIGGLDITCSVIKIADDVVSLQACLETSPEIFRHASVLLHRKDSIDDSSSEGDSSWEIHSDYEPSDTSDEFQHINNTDAAERSSLMNSANESSYLKDASLILNASYNVPGNSACDDLNLRADLSRGPKGDQKKDCCLYCQKIQAKLPRHLELKHSKEDAVASFLLLPKKSEERRKEIVGIRKKGNFFFNVTSSLNKGTLIPLRRPINEEKRLGTNFKPCPKCKGFYTINNLRHHYRQCTKKSSNSKGVLTTPMRRRQ